MEYRIPVGKTHFALVSLKDFWLLSLHDWELSTSGYAIRRALADDPFYPRGQKIYMHKEIARTPSGLVADHINGVRLDNRRENLRNCNQLQNSWNRKRGRSKSGKKGVYWNKLANKWEAKIMFKGKNIKLGVFSCLETASIAYDQAAEKYFGIYARKND